MSTPTSAPTSRQISRVFDDNESSLDIDGRKYEGKYASIVHRPFTWWSIICLAQTFICTHTIVTRLLFRRDCVTRRRVRDKVARRHV